MNVKLNLKYLLAAGVLALAGAAAPGAWAHARLESSQPKAGSALALAPKEIRLRFSDRLELPFSKIKLLGHKNVVIAPTAVALDKADPQTLVATVPALKPGPWRVQWSTITRDGHKVKGEFAFRLD